MNFAKIIVEPDQFLALKASLAQWSILATFVSCQFSDFLTLLMCKNQGSNFKIEAK